MLGNCPADAAPADAGPIDAMIDATPPDAAPVFSGTVSLQEVSVQGIPQLGSGPRLSVDFTKNPKPPVFEETPGSPTGCKVWVYTPAELAAEATQDEGTVTVVSGDGTPAIPPCTRVPMIGYLCIGGAGAGVGTIAPIPSPPAPAPGTASVTIAGQTFTAAEVGRWVKLSGATNAANNGQFPIVGVNAGSLVIANPAATMETGATVMFVIVAAQGPIPGGPNSAFSVDDTDTFTVSLMPGGSMDLPAFMTTPALAAGHAFTLDAASATLINAIPTNGGAFTLACNKVGSPAACPMALGSVLSIHTTDGPIAGLPPYVMPPPAMKQVSIRCAAIGADTITVPAAASAFLMSSGATRIETDFLRDNVSFVTAQTTVVIGHGIVGFTSP